MDNILSERRYLAGDYSIADMASFPWITSYKRYGVDLNKFTHVRRWFDDLKNRPQVRAGMDVGKENRSFGKGITQEALKTMFGQTADSIKAHANEKKND